MQLELRDQQLKIIIHIFILLYTNVIVTPNQKSVIHTQKRERNPSNTNDRNQITREKNQRRKEQKRTTKQP